MYKLILVFVFKMYLLFGLSNTNATSIDGVYPVTKASQKIVLKTGWYNVADFPEDTYPLLPIDKSSGEYDNYYIIPTPIITTKNIQTIELSNSPSPRLILHFDIETAKIWEKITGQNIGGTLVFVCDNKLIQVFKVKEKITSGTAEINRDVYNSNDLKRFKKLIEKGKKQ